MAFLTIHVRPSVGDGSTDPIPQELVNLAQALEAEPPLQSMSSDYVDPDRAALHLAAVAKSQNIHLGNYVTTIDWNPHYVGHRVDPNGTGWLSLPRALIYKAQMDSGQEVYLSFSLE